MIVVFTVPARGTELRDSVVKIHSSHRPPDFLRPWTKGPARHAPGSGVIIPLRRAKPCSLPLSMRRALCSLDSMAFTDTPSSSAIDD